MGVSGALAEAATGTEGVRVLIVDDDDDDALLARELLADARGGPYRVRRASNAEDGLAMLCGGELDVCLLDYRLGPADGLDLLRTARTRGVDIAVLMLTGTDGREVDVAATDAGADDFLVKGRLDAQLLERAIRYAIAHRKLARELQRRNTELGAAREAAEAANAAKTDFLRSMSHELRTPLNAILGFAQLLRRDRSLGERPQHFVDHVLRSGEHLVRLIDDLLDMARIEAGAVPLCIEPVAAREILEEARATLAPMALERAVHLEVAVPADLPPLEADRTRLRQIAINLGSNAIKYGRRGGRVALRAERVDGGARLVVTDDGPGIPSDLQGRLFEPFYRAGHETGPIEGTGIGLSLSRRLAEMMGGSIGFTSTPGRGSEFWVALPVAASTSSRPPSARAPAPEEDAFDRRCVVLYVEDNAASVVFMQEVLLALDGVELVVATTGEAGLALARDRLPAAVVVDINLPGISGFEVLRRLRADPATAAIPVLALSASAMTHDRERGLEAGFVRYLTKPVQIDELLGALARILPRPS